ncbi:MAG: helix-turn-helix domain-containing protein [Bacteroidales bacterium]|nr:helix-turn-helix domain-containing protein [Bacteroidales bacterium]
MSTTGKKLRKLREKTGLTLRKAAMQADVDVAILSKMERGERKLTKELILKLSEMYNEKPEKLIIDFLREKVVYELKDEEHGLKALKVAEKQLKYIKTK